MNKLRGRYPPSALCAAVVASSAPVVRAGRKWC
jgi:hypothetical protein